MKTAHVQKFRRAAQEWTKTQAAIATSTKVATATGHAVTTVVSGAGASFTAAAPAAAIAATSTKVATATGHDVTTVGSGSGTSFTAVAPGEEVWHVCELQLHIKPITDAEKTLHSHVAYEYFRAYFSGNDAAVAQRLGVLLDFGEAAETPKDMVDQVLAAAEGGTADVDALRQVADLMKMLSELELQGRVCRAIVEKEKAAHGDGSGEYATALNNLAQLLQDQVRQK